MNGNANPSRESVVLLVDDESEFRENVAEHLDHRGFHVLQAGEARAALAHMESQDIDVAFVDILMPGMDGVALLSRLKEIDPLLEVVIVTGQGSIESAVDAMRKGAFHYVTKPVRLKEIEMVARRSIEKTLVARQNRRFHEDLRRRRAQAAREIVAESALMRAVVEQAGQVARTDATVLIHGETGVGKEVLAEFIHNASNRSENLMSVINCGALSDTLLDAELFGYLKGAFTGADESRPGILEVADGGTLLLDEIGDLSPNGQMRLLRFLERGVVRRVGSTRETKLNVRVLAATHRDLLKESRNGGFREDLYHRLNVFNIVVPPLRERPEDILPLTRCFVSLQSAPGARPPQLSEEASRALLDYHWPGNVRELRHCVERARFRSQLSDRDRIEAGHLGLGSWAEPTKGLLSLKEAQKRHILNVLDHFGGNRLKAAEVLGISERHLYRLLRRIAKGNEAHERGPSPERRTSPDNAATN